MQKSLVDHLSQYAEYHRDRRNIATHFIGIPMIVLAVAVLLSRPGASMAGVWVSPAAVVVAGTVLFYLRLDLRFGALMAVLMGGACWAGATAAQESTAVWLGSGLGLFVVGWIFQLVGHVFEGRKPAFVDDLMGLVVGPLFVVVEAGFGVGLRSELAEAIEARVGPTRIRGKDALA